MGPEQLLIYNGSSHEINRRLPESNPVPLGHELNLLTTRLTSTGLIAGSWVLIEETTATYDECFFLVLAESFRFLDWMFSFFMEIGL